jgi:hypothetical protein
MSKKKWLEHFLFNDTLGTIDEMRVQLELNYTTKRMLLPVGSHNDVVDVMLLLSEEDNHNHMSPEFTAKRQTLRRKFLDSTFKDIASKKNGRRNSSNSSDGLMSELNELDTDAEETENFSDDED